VEQANLNGSNGADDSGRGCPSVVHDRERPAMTTTVLHYQAKPERAEENQQLIEAVFAELDESELDGFTYKVFRLEDGVSFIHVWIEHDVADPDSLRVVPAFQAFMADLADRCDVLPVAAEATVVGGYR
jgi:hypothetical protein